VLGDNLHGLKLWANRIIHVPVVWKWTALTASLADKRRWSMEEGFQVQQQF
jgi:hypothetical protein